MLTRHHRPRPLAWILAGCAAGLLTVGPATVADAAAAHTPARALELRGTLTATSLEIGDCSTGAPDVAVDLHGVGVLRGLGRTTMSFSARATCTEFGLGEVRDVSGRYVAANGDRLFFRGTGSVIEFQFTEEPFSLIGTFSSANHFTGGTGHFRNATGHQTMSFTHVMSAPELQLTALVSGTVRVSTGRQH